MTAKDVSVRAVKDDSLDVACFFVGSPADADGSLDVISSNPRLRF